MAAQVRGQRRGVGIALNRVLFETLGKHIGQANRNVWISHPPAPLLQGRGCRGTTFKCFEQKQAERINVGSAVHGGGRRPQLAGRPQRGQLLRRHERRRAPQPLRGAVGSQRLAREVEIQQHRLAVGGDEHVGRFQVQVDQAALVSIVQGVRQAGADPADRLHIGRLIQQLPDRTVDGRRQRLRRLGLIESLHQMLAGALLGRQSSQPFQQLRQRRAAEIRHAQQAQVSRLVLLDRIERDDLRMLQTR